MIILMAFILNRLKNYTSDSYCHKRWQRKKYKFIITTGNVRLAAAVTMNRLINDKIQEMPELKVLASLLNMIMNMQVEIKYKKANENALTYLF